MDATLLGTEERFLHMGGDVHSCMAFTSETNCACRVTNCDNIYSFNVVCDYVSVMFRRQSCFFGSHEVAFRFFDDVVFVKEVAEEIPATELDNSSSSEEEPLPPAVDFARAGKLGKNGARLQGSHIDPLGLYYLSQHPGLDNVAKAFKAYRESVEDRIAPGSAFQDTSWLNAD